LDFNFIPGDLAKACAEGFGCGFFCGEARRKGFGASVAIGEFTRGKMRFRNLSPCRAIADAMRSISIRSTPVESCILKSLRLQVEGFRLEVKGLIIVNFSTRKTRKERKTRIF